MTSCLPFTDQCEGCAVLTTQDYQFTSSLSVVFPEWLQIYSWEILFTAARSFLRKLNADTKVSLFSFEADIGLWAAKSRCRWYRRYREVK